MARLTLILGVLATVIYLLDGFRFALNEWRQWRSRMKKTGTWIGMLVGLLFAPAFADATIITAASCSETDVNTAFVASTDGDTIQIPGGTCTWTSIQSIANKSVIIQGVGAGTEAQCAVGGQTTYTCLTSTTRLLTITTHATGNTPAGYTALTGITFSSSGASGCTVASAHMVNSSGTSTNVRVHHNNFYYAGNCSALLLIDVTGVADHNLFFGHNNFQHAIIVRYSGWLGIGSYGDNSWATVSTYGESGNFFFEDNTFDTDDYSSVNGAADHNYGSRAVMRFNTVRNTQFGNHGTESGGRTRGSRHLEIYRNNFIWDQVASGPAVASLRGGSGKVFDNVATTTAPGTLALIVDFNTYRSGPSHAFASFSIWGYCGQTAVTLTRSGTTATATTVSEHGVHAGGTYIDVFGAADANFNVSGAVGTRVSSTQFTYPVANTGATSDSGTLQGTFDANTDSTGYRCVDQLGAGPGTLISGDGPGSSAVTPLGNLAQSLEPAIVSNNKLNTVLSNGVPTSFGSDVITDNQDYFNTNAACTGASCTGGIGYGTTLPTGCTPVASGIGPYYWKTNGGSWNTSTTETYSSTPGEDGVLYRCTASNTWTLDYTPYIYPHPLVTAADSASAAASPVVIARVMRWMEVAAFVTGMGWHFRKQVMAVSLAAIAGCGTLYQLAPRSYDTVKVVSKESAVKVLTVFNQLTKTKRDI